MNVKTMLEMAKQNSLKMDAATEASLSRKPAIKVVDGCRRWLEDSQIVEFDEPYINGKNAEFSIKNQSGQSIWFTQLSRVARAEDMKTAMYSTVKFKDRNECRISDQFRRASEFWEAVRGKCFKVRVMGSGFVVNNKDPKATKLMNGSATASHNNLNAEQKVFDYVRQCIENGQDNEAKGMIVQYKIYALTEI